MPQPSTLFLLNSPQAGIEVPEADAVALQRAYDQVLGLLFVEEKFGYVTENYWEFEQEISRISMESALGRHDASHDNLHQATRRLTNFLAACRMYIDQVPQDLNRMAASYDAAKFKAEASRCYDTSVAYMLMEALRNHAQHGDFPSDKLTTGGRWIGDGDASRCVHRTKLLLDLAYLRRSPKVKKAAIDVAIGKFGNEVDLVPVAREYFAYLCSIQTAARGALEPMIDPQLAAVEAAIARATKEIPGAENEGWAVAFGDQQGERVTLSAARVLNKRRLALCQRYAGSTHAHRHVYTSGDVPKA